MLLIMLFCMGLGIRFLRRTEQLAKQQMAFITSVSHELRTPLAAITSASDNLADAIITDPDRVATYGRLIRAESHRLKTMVDTVFDYAKASSELRKSAPEPCDPAEVVDQILGTWMLRFRENGVKMVACVNKDLPQIPLDSHTWSTIVHNLLSNALKYGKPGQTIAISLTRDHREEGDQVIFSVRDQGIGIPMDEHVSVFDRFFRGEQARTSKIPGSGLGLCLVRQILNNNGSHIWVSSMPNLGSTFTVRIPCIHDPSANLKWGKSG